METEKREKNGLVANTREFVNFREKAMSASNYVNDDILSNECYFHSQRNKHQMQCEDSDRDDNCEGKDDGNDDTIAVGEDYPAVNLDSGYAWLMLAIMFLLNSSISGSSRVYGLVYARQVSIGYYDRAEASWPIATSSAVENLAGILMPALAQFLSWRQIEILASLLFVISNLLAYFSDSLLCDILALGVIQGFALSINTVLALAINNDYFERYRTTACGIAMSGSTFGVLYLSPLVAWILEAYENFRLVYFALACVFCGNILLSLFIMPRSKLNQMCRQRSAQIKHQQGRRLQQQPRCGSRNLEARSASIIEEQRRCNYVTSNGSIKRDKSSLANNLDQLATAITPQDSASSPPPTGGAHKSQPLERKMSIQKTLSRLEMRLERENSVASISDYCKTRRQSQWSRKSIVPFPNVASNSNLAGQANQKKISIISNGTLHLTPNSSFGGLTTTFKSPSSIDLENYQFEEKFPARNYHATTSFNNGKFNSKHVTMADSCDDIEEDGRLSLKTLSKLLKLPYLHCTWVMLAIYYLVSRVFMIILVDYADDHGLDFDESRSLLNFWSLGEITGRILLGSFIDLKFLSVKHCITLTCSLLAIFIGLMVLYANYYVYALCSVSIAALVSLEYMLINVFMIEYIGKNKVTVAYPIAAFISSTILFARPNLIGLFRDTLGSYDGLLLLLAGIPMVFTTIFVFFEPILVRFWKPANTLSKE